LTVGGTWEKRLGMRAWCEPVPSDVELRRLESDDEGDDEDELGTQ